ncbi:HisA/HisF-related TIM barrel protein [Anatilimnocola floriformis]|uniref:HisA/HisF-related TIM barrel protein n=1 Tax=Anatilimnocola floriformis TaxID=2948575 RepID=UPI0020C263AC|nr:HisA/HisF-related TIM barrel protein [Anatilimnocola floriformis]
MRVVPVIDLLGGMVVRGVGGRRDEYRPIVSSLVDSAEPQAVAAALRQHFGLPRVYVADLDAIMRGERDVKSWRAIADAGLQLSIDAGLKSADEANELEDFLARDFAEAEYVIGLESWQDLAELAKLSRPEVAVFSLDLKQGRPLTKDLAWQAATPQEIVAEVYRHGLRRLIVLDLADVGSGQGTSTLSLIRQFLARWPDLQIVAGGGIRGPADLRELQAAGIRGALVASALHDGRLTAQDII